MVVPAVLLFAVFFIIPVFFTFDMSLTNQRLISTDIDYVGLENYAKALRDPLLFTGVKNSLLYAVATVLLQNLIALPVAVVLNSKLKGRTAFRAIFFSPAVLSTLVVGYLWGFILQSGERGLLNRTLESLGAGRANLLGTPSTALWAVILTQVWQWFGYAMVIYLANLQSIPDMLYEAAAIDGCSGWKAFWHITLPGLLPAIRINAVTGMISGLKVFDIVFALTGGGPGYATQTVLLIMYRKFAEGRLAYAAAFGVMFLIVVLLVTALMLRLLKRIEARLS
jgi:raffinose/stachyose/melibiose transport system permease protein